MCVICKFVCNTSIQARILVFYTPGPNKILRPPPPPLFVRIQLCVSKNNTKKLTKDKT
jgi:hypothetical protein